MKTLRSLLLAVAITGLSGAYAAAGSLTTTIQDAIIAHAQGTALFGAPSFDLSAQSQPNVTLQNGTGSNQADLIFSDTRTLSASGTEDLDVYGGLEDAFGTTLNFHKIKAIKVAAKAANTNNVVIGNATSNPFTGPLGGTTPTITVPPGGQVLLIAPVSGWAVTNSSNDNLRFTNSGSGSSVSYDVVIVGTSN